MKLALASTGRVSDDDDTVPPVLCYCERPAALLDGRWVCAQLVEGDFCIWGREDEPTDVLAERVRALVRLSSPGILAGFVL